MQDNIKQTNIYTVGEKERRADKKAKNIWKNNGQIEKEIVFSHDSMLLNMISKL